LGSQYPEILIPLKQTLFLEITRSHSEPYQGNRVIFHVTNQIWAKVQAFLYEQLQYFHIISLVECLTLWDKFKVNSTLDIEENDEHCLHLWFQHASSL
jgi:hypothetical protein